MWGGAIAQGASSIIFWWRLWMEQSRPKSEIAFPYWSAKIWTSKWWAQPAVFIIKIGDPGTSACTFIFKNKMESCNIIVWNTGHLSNLSEKVREIIGGFRFTDTFTTATLTGLDHNRKTDPLCRLKTFFCRFDTTLPVQLGWNFYPLIAELCFQA